MQAKSHINPYHYLLLFHYLTVQEPFYYQTDDILEKNDSCLKSQDLLTEIPINKPKHLFHVGLVDGLATE